jgi:hypothetical protein
MIVHVACFLALLATTALAVAALRRTRGQSGGLVLALRVLIVAGIFFAVVELGLLAGAAWRAGRGHPAAAATSR